MVIFININELSVFLLNLFIDNILPTENREHSVEEKPRNEVIKISDIPSVQPSTTIENVSKESDINGLPNSRRKNRKKFDKNKPVFEQVLDKISTTGTYSDYSSKKNKKNDKKISVGEREELLNVTSEEHTVLTCSTYTSPTLSSTNTVHVLVNRLNDTSLNKGNKKQNLNINRQLPRTAGICTQGSSTSGPSRLAVSSQTEGLIRKSDVPSTSTCVLSTEIPVISSIAVTTSTLVITTQSDPRTQMKYITPLECNGDWEEEVEDDTDFDKVGYARSG